jgi:hypothetical protein
MTQRIPTSSTGAARAHGPTRARRSAGELHGPAEHVSRQVRRIRLDVEQIDGGRWRLTMGSAPGWSAVASNAGQLVAAVRSGFVEGQVAAYSSWRGHVYDEPSAPEHRRHRPSARSSRRCDVYEATAWRLGHDGRWISPGGNRFPESRQVVQRVMAQRQAMGLSARPDPVAPDYVRPTPTRMSRYTADGGEVRLVDEPVRLTRPGRERSSA